MIKRPFWLLTGVALGVGGTIWVERQVREAVQRLEPDNLAREVVERTRDGARRVGGRVLDAVETGRAASEQRERELRREMRLGPRLREVRARDARHRRSPSPTPGRLQARR